MQNPWVDAGGGDTQLGQLYKIDSTGGGLNPYQKTQYNSLLQAAGLPAGATPSNYIQMKSDAASAKQKAETDAFNATQEAKQTDFINRFKTAVGGQESLSDASNRIGNTLGLPDLRTNAQNLTKSVAMIPKVQTDATRGYNVNSNQLSQIIASKQAQLAPAAQQAVTQQQTGEQQLGQQLGYLQTDQAKQLQPLELEGSMLSDQIAREMTGFTQDKTNALNAYLAQLDAGTKLTLQQMQDANALAQAHIQYDNVKSQVQNQVVAAGSSLYDPTGKLLATAPLKTTSSTVNSGTWS